MVAARVATSYSPRLSAVRSVLLQASTNTNGRAFRGGHDDSKSAWLHRIRRGNELCCERSTAGKFAYDSRPQHNGRIVHIQRHAHASRYDHVHANRKPVPASVGHWL